MIPFTLTVEKSGGALVFTPRDLESLSYVQSLSFDGDTVQADEISVVVRARTGDAADFLTQWQGVTRNSVVWLTSSAPGGRVEKYYFKSPLRRIGRSKYRIDAQSPLGRLTADFPGDLYNAAPLPAVIAAVIGNAAPYTCNPLLAAVRVHGWAPYQTRRETLHALALAYGFLIRRDASYNLYFTVPDTDSRQIPASNIFTGGSVAYSIGDTYRRADVTARDYRRDPDAEMRTLFDNSGSAPVERLVVKFDKPMFDLAASDDLIVHDGESGVNYAVVSGVGVLTGKPYAEFISVVSVDGDPDADEQRVLSVADAPLITSLNAVSVGERLLNYRNAEASVNADIIRTTQRPGDLVSFTDPFGDARTGYIASLSGSITSIDRAAVSIVCGYAPTWGAAYDSVAVLTGSGTWTAPGNLDGKTVRVVLIGGGQGGSSGQHGTDDNAVGSGRGLPGSGGAILDVKIPVRAGQTFQYACGQGGAGGAYTGETVAERPDNMTVYVTRTGDRWHVSPSCNGGSYTPTTLRQAVAKHLTPCENCVRDNAAYYVSNSGQPGTPSVFGEYSSDDGRPANVGFYDIIDGKLYASPGSDNGVDGGSATSGCENDNRNAPEWTDLSHETVSLPWDSAQNWTSGNPGEGAHQREENAEGRIEEWAYGGLGGGAAVGNNGHDGNDARNWYTGGDGGNGADASAIFPPAPLPYGVGGSGGHGGGEGAFGGTGHSVASYSGGAWIGVNGRRGSGGAGASGQNGADGCVLIYFKKPDELQYSFSVRDGQLVLTYYTAEPPPFSVDANRQLVYAHNDGDTPPVFEIRNKILYRIE